MRKQLGQVGKVGRLSDVEMEGFYYYYYYCLAGSQVLPSPQCGLSSKN